MEKDKRGKLLLVSFLLFLLSFLVHISNVRVARLPATTTSWAQSWDSGPQCWWGTLKLPLQHHRACQETLTAMGMSPRQPKAGQVFNHPPRGLHDPFPVPLCNSREHSQHRTGRTLPAPGKTPHFTFAWPGPGLLGRPGVSEQASCCWPWNHSASLICDPRPGGPWPSAQTAQGSRCPGPDAASLV